MNNTLEQKTIDKKTGKKTSSVLRLTTLALLAAISIVLVFANFSIFPAAPHLKLEFANVPLIIAAFAFGPLPSLAALFAVCFIQAFLLAGDGIPGFLMHFVASGAMLLAIGLIGRVKTGASKRRHGIVRRIVALGVGVVVMTALMIPMNYIVTPLFYMGGYSSTSIGIVTSTLLPVIIPFNLIKSISNCVLAGALFAALTPVLRRMGLID